MKKIICLIFVLVLMAASCNSNDPLTEIFPDLVDSKTPVTLDDLHSAAGDIMTATIGNNEVTFEANANYFQAQLESGDITDYYTIQQELEALVDEYYSSSKFEVRTSVNVSANTVNMSSTLQAAGIEALVTAERYIYLKSSSYEFDSSVIGVQTDGNGDSYVRVVFSLLYQYTGDTTVFDGDYMYSLAKDSLSNSSLKNLLISLSSAGYLETPNSSGDKALLLAAEFIDMDTINLLLELGANRIGADIGTKLVDTVSSNNNTPLCLAYIAAGANLNMRDSSTYGYTALMRASSRGNTEVVKALVEAGASLEMKDNYSASDIDMYSQQTALIWASCSGYTDVIEILLESGANIEATSRHGWTALIMASRFGKTNAIQVLLEYGANINARGNNGYTALIFIVIFALKRCCQRTAFTN